MNSNSGSVRSHFPQFINGKWVQNAPGVVGKPVAVSAVSTSVNPDGSTFTNTSSNAVTTFTNTVTNTDGSTYVSVYSSNESASNKLGNSISNDWRARIAEVIKAIKHARGGDQGALDGAINALEAFKSVVVEAQAAYAWVGTGTDTRTRV